MQKKNKIYKNNSKNKITGKNLLFALTILIITFLAELIGGLISGSLALVSDSFHVLTDILSLGLTYIALNIAIYKEPSKQFPFGFHRLEVFATIFNGITLVFIAGFIISEALDRFSNPSEINIFLALTIAIVGLGVNLTSMLILSSHHEHKTDMNIRSAWWHIMGDTLASVGVIIGLTAIYFFKMPVIDPVIAVLISLLLLKGGISVTWEAIRLLLQECPIDTGQAKSLIKELPHVLDVDGMFFWELCSHIRIGTLHVITDLAEIKETHRLYDNIKDLLREKFNIKNVTIQFKTSQMVENHSHSLHHEH
ncbi:MAG: cation diffusion facilitator family transporter [Nitrospinota bacterium]|jgi:cobalt-zinc-cadmium efflux system protein|nr:cation transporter [Nitrospinota bacterium]MDP7351077.1 cation diffusion facilitator family transporter [Nitrospinota bacterium]MDP7580102.1 cation diffusion facilitator family transporter [Nitrospinota bacterium]HJN02131.1 cation diffusion facilitator family transporter [Nitrospinota bacterium]|tara:strand:- start:1021 stop:1947 length:927 start_codon:yes stop_codon:yes gene_type:complete